MAQPMKVTVYKCDGCGRLVQGTETELPKGFHGTIKEIHPDGNTGPKDFFAHTDRCIKTAALAVLGLL